MRVAIFILLLMSQAADLPDAVNPVFIFYLHGQIVEDQGPQPIHDRWGLYDYPAIVDALAENGAHVISEVRASGTDVNAYAHAVAAEIEALVDSGVPAQQITVVGFSKGGAIAILVSNLLTDKDIRFVLLAACGDWISSNPELQLNGNILSIYEKSDGLAGSCKRLAKRNANLSSFEEQRISTRKEHGAFYLPRPAWVEPLRKWIAKDLD